MMSMPDPSQRAQLAFPEAAGPRQPILAIENRAERYPSRRATFVDFGGLVARDRDDASVLHADLRVTPCRKRQGALSHRDRFRLPRRSSASVHKPAKA